MRRSRTVSVDVEVELSDIPVKDLIAEYEDRGLGVGGPDLDLASSRMRRGDIEGVLLALERVLPREFLGLTEEARRHFSNQRAA